MWQTINDILKYKKKSTTKINSIETPDDVITENLSEISNHLNEYFSNVGKNLTKEISDLPIGSNIIPSS